MNIWFLAGCPLGLPAFSMFWVTEVFLIESFSGYGPAFCSQQG
jgi:hypothetical protein